MIAKHYHFQNLTLGVICAGLCVLNSSAYALNEDDDSSSTEEDIKGQIASVQGLPIPKTEFEIQAEMTETKQQKAKTESSAKQLRRRAKNIKDLLAKPENQPAKHKAQFASVRAAFEEKIRNNAPMERKEFISAVSTILSGAEETDDPGVSDEEREAFNAIDSIRNEARRLMAGSDRIKADDVKRFREQFLDDTKIRLYEAAVDVSARVRAKRAEQAEKLATDQEGLAKAYADHLNKLSEALAGQAKNQAKVVNDLVEKLPMILGILCALFAVIILLVRFFPDTIQIEWVGSGQVIQLLTVVTLLLIILCLAVTDILKENTIGTLLGGIGGYVLSQGIGRAAARAATRTQQAIQA